MYVNVYDVYYSHFSHQQYTAPSTHYLHAGLKLTPSLHQASPRTDNTVLTPKTVSITDF